MDLKGPRDCLKGPSGYMGESCRELKGPRVDLKALGEVAGSRRVDLECPGMDFGIPGVGIYPIAPPAHLYAHS